ncbi:hypothetical protein GGQ73_000952 [Rhizobium skierniewicense]|uniref:Uncharacterized protein n=1 Tax=Rhizobium skierniewicense TaxID=984260 RepID=A0A7W6C3E3_9HYPH|nr:hypothetical protein [Rhizobium skierniewicense]
MQHGVLTIMLYNYCNDITIAAEERPVLSGMDGTVWGILADAAMPAGQDQPLGTSKGSQKILGPSPRIAVKIELKLFDHRRSG